MKTIAKALLVAVSAVMVFAASMFGTVAYFTAGDSDISTFTVGQVHVSAVDVYAGAARASTFSLRGAAPVSTKVVPGTPIPTEPIVTLADGSESAYVRILLTFSGVSAMDAVYGADEPDGKFRAEEFLNTEVSGEWTCGVWREDAEADTRTVEFRYYQPVEAKGEDKTLPAPFTSITFAGAPLAGLDNDTKAAMFEGFGMSAAVQAIQSEGFADADAAWAAYPEE